MNVNARTLYEPKLVDRWRERYRAFETDEMIREAKRKRRVSAPKTTNLATVTEPAKAA
jgi:hypothetical protein